MANLTLEELYALRHEVAMDKIEHTRLCWKNPFHKGLPALRKRICKNTKTIESALCDMDVCSAIDKRIFWNHS